VRYPRGSGPGVEPRKEMTALPIGKGEIRRNLLHPGTAHKVAILAFGAMLAPSLQAAEEIDATVANMRFVKPLDDELILRLARDHELLVTVEENVVMGGAGSAVLETLQRNGLTTAVLQLGLPDHFIDQGDPALQLAECGLNKAGIMRSIEARRAQ
jgi:1-deoxy-D-xylulose-5-phosphate synthase